MHKINYVLDHKGVTSIGTYARYGAYVRWTTTDSLEITVVEVAWHSNEWVSISKV